jgi:hypothetical protein
MKRKRFFVLKEIIIVTVLGIIVYTGCVYNAKQIPIVVIRETQLRTCKMVLPLNGESKKKLVEYLKKGGDWEIPDISPYYKKDFYDRLLGLLDDDDSKIEMTDLFTKETKEVWVLKEDTAKCFRSFRKYPIYGVVDSCLERPNLFSYKPFSLFDGHLWWVFYRDEGDPNWIHFVQVTLPVEGTVPPSWKMKY